MTPLSATELVRQYWPQLAFVASLIVSVGASIHIVMHKRDVPAAVGWVGVVMLSPLLGALLYVIAGINRVRIRRVSEQREALLPDDYPGLQASSLDLAQEFGTPLAGQKVLGDAIADFPLLDGNTVRALDDGDAIFAAMLDAIRGARRSICMQSYIFDYDRVGLRFVEALIGAHERGVAVRVLVDAVGERYSRRPIHRLLQRRGVRCARFRTGSAWFRLAYANLRSHRKLLVVDGAQGFTGGMNIREAFSAQVAGERANRDTHFRLEGPVVLQLMYCFAHDWEFTTRESLYDETWFAQATAPGHVSARCVPSGPDHPVGSSHAMLMGGLAAAQHRVLIQTPYFLPDAALLGALATTARRGVAVDIVIPGHNNLRLVDYAMSGQLAMVLETGCRVWRTGGCFDHSKLMAVDGLWSYVGSSNLDPRSMRLNFELDVEIFDRDTAGHIERRIRERIDGATPETLQRLAALPFLAQLRNKVVWLASPYL